MTHNMTCRGLSRATYVLQALCFLGLLCPVVSHAADPVPTASDSERQWLEKHRGKAGLYLRLAKKERTNRPDFYLSHPLVDAAVFSVPWAAMEPEPGRYDFSEVNAILGLCEKHQKGLVLCVSTYGQNPGKQPTPEWLYEKGVKRIRFPGGGTAKGKDICVPKVWDKAYYREYGKLIQALGKRYNGDSRIWYIMPGFGHIGNVNAQPSKHGGPAFLAEGWTPAIWTDHCLAVVESYQEAFPDTPLRSLAKKIAIPRSWLRCLPF